MPDCLRRTAAARATCYLSSAFFQACFTLRGNIDVNFQAHGMFKHFHAVNLLCMVHQAFCQCKPQRKIFQVQRCGHHDRMADTVEHQRHGHFVCQLGVRGQRHVHLPTTSKLSACALANKSNWVLLNRW